MNKNGDYDEKQLIDRGKAFQYGFFVAIFINLLSFFVQGVLEITMNTYGLFLINLWLPLTTCIIIMIIKEAYDGVNSTPGRVSLTVVGIAGLFLFLSSLKHLITGEEIFIENGVLTDLAGHILNGFCLILICLTYWIKNQNMKKKYEEE